jgi:hypothetical protein
MNYSELPQGWDGEGSVPKGVENLMYQLLETEIGGVEVYEKAIECAISKGLKSEWQKYLKETEKHVEIAKELLLEMNLDPGAETTGRQIVRKMGRALVDLIDTAKAQEDPETAQIVACEAVIHAETKDHLNWELVGQLARGMKGNFGQRLLEAQREVEEQEDEHLYHTKGWGRELWLQSLGLKAELPPPEEKKDVHSASEAERAKKSSGARRMKARKSNPAKSRLARHRR